MILGQKHQYGPFVPVVPPHGDGDWENSNVVPLFGETEDEAISRKRDELFAKLSIESAAKAKRDFLIFGLSGVALGSLVTGGVMALSLRSYKSSGSIVGPAIYATMGSAAVGGAMVLLLARLRGGEKVDDRVAALAVGAIVSA